LYARGVCVVVCNSVKRASRVARGMKYNKNRRCVVAAAAATTAAPVLCG